MFALGVFVGSGGQGSWVSVVLLVVVIGARLIGQRRRRALRGPRPSRYVPAPPPPAAQGASAYSSIVPDDVSGLVVAPPPPEASATQPLLESEHGAARPPSPVSPVPPTAPPRAGVTALLDDETELAPKGRGLAPGWFVDPFAHHDHRYWSGSTWTEHVSDDGRLGIDPLPSAST